MRIIITVSNIFEHVICIRCELFRYYYSFRKFPKLSVFFIWRDDLILFFFFFLRNLSSSCSYVCGFAILFHLLLPLITNSLGSERKWQGHHIPFLPNLFIGPSCDCSQQRLGLYYSHIGCHSSKEYSLNASRGLDMLKNWPYPTHAEHKARFHSAWRQMPRHMTFCSLYIWAELTWRD